MDFIKVYWKPKADAAKVCSDMLVNANGKESQKEMEKRFEKSLRQLAKDRCSDLGKEKCPSGPIILEVTGGSC